MDGPRAAWNGRARAVLDAFAPAIITLVLSLPVFAFRFVSDDFNFLIRAWHLAPGDLLPDPRSLFYRPVSRELYFAGLAALGRGNPLWGHLANALLAILVTLLVMHLAKRLTGHRTGLLTGILFAGLGASPLLVGWVSGAQDLLAMLFTLAALHFQIGRRTARAVSCMAIALLCKESAIFFLPALAMTSALFERERGPLRRHVAPYAALGGVWCLVHPLLRGLAASAPGEGRYVGLGGGLIASNLLREFGAAINVPIGADAVEWPSYLEPSAFLAVAVAAVALWREPTPGVEAAGDQPPTHRVAVFAILVGIVPAALTALTGMHWFPYYASFPAIGTSLLAGIGLSKLKPPIPLLATAVFIVLGVWSRGADFGGRLTPNERNLRVISSNLGHIEAELKKLHPTFPDHSRLYMSVQTPESLYLQHHILKLQAPKVWYANVTIETADPSRMRRGSGPEYLFWVTRDCEVFEVVLDGMRVRSPGPRPNIRAYQMALRSLAYGYLATGEVERAASILVTMEEVDSLTWAFDRRLAAAMLFAAGRSNDARHIVRQLPPMSPQGSLDAIAAALGPNVPGVDLDAAAFQAFGVSQSDPEAYRFLMRHFVGQSQLTQAMRMANRLSVLAPGDPEAESTIQAIRSVPNWDQVVSPIDPVGPSSSSEAVR